MGEVGGRTIVVVNGRVHELPAHPRVSRAPQDEAAARWTSLGLWGGLIVVLGALVGADLGAVAAVGGFALFLTTAVAAGAERYEAATALGACGIVWTAAGISVYLGVDPSLPGSLLGFVLVGSAALVAGLLGVGRLRAGGESGPKREP